MSRWSLMLLLLMASASQVCLGEILTDVGGVAADKAGTPLPRDLLWTADCRSLTSCATSCMNDQKSLSFTVSPKTGPKGHRQCRCYGASSVKSVSDVLQSGHKLYQFRQRFQTASKITTTTTTTTTTKTTTTAAPVSPTCYLSSWQGPSCGGWTPCYTPNSECSWGSCKCRSNYIYDCFAQTCVDIFGWG